MSQLCPMWLVRKPTRFENWLWETMESLDEQATIGKIVLYAITAPRLNHSGTPLGEIQSWLQFAGREKMLTAGEPLPTAGPFTLYRGVSGVGRSRRLRGVSWTDSIDVARFFCDRFSFEKPAIITMTIAAEHVYSYTNDRKEREFMVIVPGSMRLRQMERS
jgi:hypothetical protein